MLLVTIDIGANDPEACGSQPGLPALAEWRNRPADLRRLGETLGGCVGLAYIRVPDQTGYWVGVAV